MTVFVNGPALPQPGPDHQPWASQLHSALMNLLNSYSRAINTNAVAPNVAAGALKPGRPGEIAFITGTLKPAYYDGSDWRYFDTNAVV